MSGVFSTSRSLTVGVGVCAERTRGKNRTARNRLIAVLLRAALPLLLCRIVQPALITELLFVWLIITQVQRAPYEFEFVVVLHHNLLEPCSRKETIRRQPPEGPSSRMPGLRPRPLQSYLDMYSAVAIVHPATRYMSPALEWAEGAKSTS